MGCSSFCLPRHAWSLGGFVRPIWVKPSPTPSHFHLPGIRYHQWAMDGRLLQALGGLLPFVPGDRVEEPAGCWYNTMSFSLLFSSESSSCISPLNGRIFFQKIEILFLLCIWISKWFCRTLSRGTLTESTFSPFTNKLPSKSESEILVFWFGWKVESLYCCGP